MRNFVLLVLIFINSYVILSNIGNGDKQMWFATFNPQLSCEWGGGAMIEAILLEIIYLLLFGLVVETIIVFALVILVIILSK